jgi:dihydroorotate dehydrogenase
MADLTTDFLGIKSPNPFWLASAPPTDKEYNVVRAFKAGWGGVVWKTLGEEGPPIVNVNGPRYGAIWGADRRLLGLNNIELITDRPLEVNLREIKQVKRDWPDRAMIVSIMVPCEEAAWKAILPLVEETGADGIELNFGCPHGMSERGMGSAVGQVPEYIEMVTRWCKQNTRMPVIVKLTPNITDIRYPARAAKKGGADAVSLINTISSITSVDLDTIQPEPIDRRQGLPRRLLRPGGEAHRAQHGGRDRARPGDAWPADLRHRRRHHLARRGGVPGAGRGHRAGLHGGHDLRVQDRGGDEIGPQPVSRREGHGLSDLVGPRGAERHRLAVPQPQLRHQGAHRPGRLHQVRALLRGLRGHLAPGDHHVARTASSR